ncbi:MAG: (4Fe-4S)-binding protein [Saprospiraceae bacterium]
MVKKEYTNGEITVIWQPGLCIHSAICFHSLPEVFKPRDRPWIQMDQSDTKSITDTVNACPSGALSLKISAETQAESIPIVEMGQVKIMPNGPVRFSGPCLVTLQDGTVVEKPNGVGICRCGGSAVYPFCDGSHRTNGFSG